LALLTAALIFSSQSLCVPRHIHPNPPHATLTPWDSAEVCPSPEKIPRTTRQFFDNMGFVVLHNNYKVNNSAQAELD
jgi:hypothetical protein